MHKIPLFVEPGVVLKLGIKLSADILIREGTKLSASMISRVHLMDEFILLL